MVRAALALALLAALLGGTSCSVKRMAVNSIAGSLTSGPDVFATDDDPELVGDAIPFGLKLMDMLLQMSPKNQNLLLAACRGYTQYAMAYLQLQADAVEPVDYDRAVQLRGRALGLYLRARGHGLRGLELRYRGIGDQLALDPSAAAARVRARDLPIAYWTAAAWGSAISLGKDRPELLGDLGVVRALLERGLALDERFEGGAIHEAMIVLEALPPAMGGSPERARAHFERAVELAGGTRASPYLTMAQSVAVQAQDRGGFERLLNQALEVDPNRDPNQRLANLVLQRRARSLLERGDELFFEPDTLGTEESR